MNNDSVPSREELKHMDEVLKLMSVVAEEIAQKISISVEEVEAIINSLNLRK